MAIFRGIVRNGVVIPETPLPFPEGSRVQIVAEGSPPENWDEAFRRLKEVAQIIAQVAAPNLNLGKLVQDERGELEGNG